MRILLAAVLALAISFSAAAGESGAAGATGVAFDAAKYEQFKNKFVYVEGRFIRVPAMDSNASEDIVKIIYDILGGAPKEAYTSGQTAAERKKIMSIAKGVLAETKPGATGNIGCIEKGKVEGGWFTNIKKSEDGVKYLVWGVPTGKKNKSGSYENVTVCLKLYNAPPSFPKESLQVIILEEQPLKDSRIDVNKCWLTVPLDMVKQGLTKEQFVELLKSGVDLK